MSTLRINNIEAQAVPASPSIDEKIKLTNSSGDVLVHVDGKTSGITTIGINTTAGNIKFDQNSNVVVTGIITATKFVGTIEPTNLTVSGDLTIPDKIIHSGDTNTTIRFPAADTITAETGGSERLRITSDGKFGFGTASLSENSIAEFTRDVGGGALGASITIRNSSTNSVNNIAELRLKTAHGVARFYKYNTGSTIIQSHTSGTSDLLLYADGASNLRLHTNGTERLRIDSSGNVMMGVTSSSNRFHVEGTTTGSRFGVDDSASGITALAITNEVNADLETVIYTNKVSLGSSVNIPICFHTNGKANEKLRIDTGGRLLLGLTSGTGALLQVNQGAQVYGAANDGNSSCLTMDYSSSTGRIMGHGSSGGTLSFFTNFSSNGVQESMRLNNIDQQTAPVLRLFKPRAASNVQSHMIHFLVAGNHERGAIAAGSSFGSTPSFTSISDYRVKTNIRNYTGGWDNIKALPVKLFDINKEGEEATDIKGWIAHEVQAVIPEAVVGTKDAKKADGSDDYQSLGYNVFMPDVVSALQKAITKIETLEAEVAALKGS